MIPELIKAFAIESQGGHEGLECLDRGLVELEKKPRPADMLLGQAS